MSLRCAPLWLAAGLLAACVSAPPAALPGRDAVRDFALEARFALRVTAPGEAAQSSGGRLSWEHRRGGDRVLISSPLGYGLAEIDITPTVSRLQTADGKTRESADPDALMEEVTGQRLPVSQLPAWLLGRSGGKALITSDDKQRPSSLREAGWLIEYAYDEADPDALPSRLTLSQGSEIELRLRIEEWKETP